MAGPIIMTISKDAVLTQVASKTAVEAKKSTVSVRRGYLILMTSTVAFSVNGILLKTALLHFDSMLIPFWRVLLVALVLGIALAVYQPRALKVRAQHIPFFVTFGVVGIGLQQIVWTLSVKWNGVAVATVLVSIAPAFVALLAWRFLRESFSSEKLVALLLSSAGVALISRVYEAGTLNFNGLGILVGIGTGIAWGTYSVLGRFAAIRYSAWTVTFYSFSFAALFLLLFRIFLAMVASPRSAASTQSALEFLFPNVELQWWLILLIMALGPTLGGFALYTIGLSHVSASVASLIGTMEPVLSIVLAFLVYGELLSPIQIIGATLILASMFLISVRANRIAVQKQT